MVRVLLSVFFIAAGSLHAKVEAKSKPVEKSVALAPSAPVSSMELAPVQEAAAPSVQIRLAPALMTLINDGETLSSIGGAASIGFFSNGRTDIGLDIGYYQVKESKGLDPVTLSTLPVQLSWLHRFSESAIRPYLGFSVGVTVLSVSNSTESGSVLLPSLALRPGVEFQMTRNIGLYLEARGGLLLTIPYFNPQAGLAFNL